LLASIFPFYGGNGVTLGSSPVGYSSQEPFISGASVPQANSFTSTPTGVLVSPFQRPVPASAASMFGVNSPSGIGRVWPDTGLITSNLQVGMYGLGGYTLFPPGYNATLVSSTAAQCPGIARILAVQAGATN
jgi:hypothetical protein